VDDYPGRVDHPAETGLDLKIDLFLKERIEGLKREKGLAEFREVLSAKDVLAQPFQSLSDSFNHDSAGMDL
jgi:hypothetical protein